MGPCFTGETTRITSAYWITRLLIGLLACFVVSPGALAQDEEKKKTEVFTLGEVIVTADADTKESPAAITEITAEDIERQNATNVGEALKLIPGVHLRQGRQTDEYYVTMRGFEQDKVLILLDGVPLYIPYEGVLNLSDIPVQNIAKIEVIRGNASVLYGPNSMGGVINVVTKTGSEVPTTALDTKIGDYDTQHYTFTHGWKVKNLSYFFGASHRESDGYNLAKTYRTPDSVNESVVSAPSNPSSLAFKAIAPDEGRRDNTDYDRDAITLSSTLDIADNHKLGLSFEWYGEDYGVSPSPRYREHKKGFFYFPRYYEFTDWERYVINLSDEYKFTDTFRIKVRGYYDDYYNVLHSYDDDTYTTEDRVGPPSGRSVYDDYTAGGELYAFWDVLPCNSIRSGLSFKRDVHKEHMGTDPYDELVSHTWSYALEDVLRVTDNVSVTMGASYDFFDKKKRDQPAAADDDAGDDVHALDPQIAVSYDPSDTVNLYASAARKIRFPTMRNLYASGVLGPQGDPNLNEQRSYNYEAGATWRVCKSVVADASVFYSDVKDYIYFDNIIGRFEQFSDARIYGLELSVSSQIARNLFGRLSYTFIETQVLSDVFLDNDTHEDLVFDPDEIPYHPEHKIDLDITQTFNFGMSIDVNGSFIGSQNYLDYVNPNSTQTLIANEKEFGSYVLLNAKVTQQFTGNIQGYVAVENLLNKDYQDLYLLPARGITPWIGIKLEL
ncbi:MAG TPA: TonB-dependent receptor [Thermodesulfobacteriota bacterium]|nr:TonB-dependent receptor [Thermodesulfobacteriota bacterium]HNU71872.1 TonB-dependent receptor [Thermodesulfobacteriota bacterium]